MSRQRARIEALEKRKPKETKLPLIFISLCEGGHGAPIVSRLAMAHVIGVGRITRHEGETEAEFERRAYAMHAAQRPLEEMTEEELEVALASVEQVIAMETANTVRPGDGDEGREGLPLTYVNQFRRSTRAGQTLVQCATSA